jgi:hypothetical protein
MKVGIGRTKRSTNVVLIIEESRGRSFWRVRIDNLLLLFGLLGRRGSFSIGGSEFVVLHIETDYRGREQCKIEKKNKEKREWVNFKFWTCP